MLQDELHAAKEATSEAKKANEMLKMELGTLKAQATMLQDELHTVKEATTEANKAKAVVERELSNSKMGRSTV